MRISDWSSDVCASDLERGDDPRAWAGFLKLLSRAGVPVEHEVVIPMIERVENVDDDLALHGVRKREQLIECTVANEYRRHQDVARDGIIVASAVHVARSAALTRYAFRPLRGAGSNSHQTRTSLRLGTRVTVR